MVLNLSGVMLTEFGRRIVRAWQVQYLLGAHMQLINDIIQLLSDEKATVQSALLKAQVLAHRLGDTELSRWVENELRGYPADAEVPPYRILKLTLIGHVTNGYYHYSNQTLAVGHLKEPARTNLTKNIVRESVSAIESWFDRDNIAITIPAEALHMLSKPLSDSYFVQQAWGKFSVGAVEQILVQVRSRLLGFCLKITDGLPADLPDPQVREVADQMNARDIFRNAVFGDNVTVVVGSGTISEIKNKVVVRHDLDSLLANLKEQGVGEGDLATLRTAIADDKSSEDVRNGKLGPRVRSWVGTMVGKAGSAAWEVSMGAAGNLLASALGSYYGIGT